MSVTATLPERYNASTIVDRQIAAARGPKIAFVAEDRSLTYDALASEVNRAGRLLLELGVGREDRVLLVLDDTTVFPVVFLAAMRIGAIPAPVSSLDRADNFRHYVRDSYASLVVTDATGSRRCAPRSPTRTSSTSCAAPAAPAWSSWTPGWRPRTTGSTRPRPTATTWRSGCTARGRRASRRASCTCSTTSRSRARATRATSWRCATRT